MTPQCWLTFISNPLSAVFWIVTAIGNVLIKCICLDLKVMMHLGDLGVICRWWSLMIHVLATRMVTCTLSSIWIIWKMLHWFFTSISQLMSWRHLQSSQSKQARWINVVMLFVWFHVEQLYGVFWNFFAECWKAFWAKFHMDNCTRVQYSLQSPTFLGKNAYYYRHPYRPTLQLHQILHHQLLVVRSYWEKTLKNAASNCFGWNLVRTV